MQKHEPPENLPLAPDRDTTQSAEDVHFRDQEPEDTIRWPKGGVANRYARRAPVGPLQLNHPDMGPTDIAVNTELLDVRAAATRLNTTKDTIYGLVRSRRLPHYRMASAIRFRETDLDAYLASLRVEATPTAYGRAKDQR